MAHDMFEYKLVPQPRCQTIAEVETFLNDYGKQGWALCGIDYGCFILKRSLLPVLTSVVSEN